MYFQLPYMPAPYSYDLRQKAISAFERGERKTHVCRIFNLSRNTLDLWLKRKKETGDFFPRRSSASGQPPKIKDLEKFKQFVLKYNHKTQKEIAQLWGDNLTQQNVSDAYQKLGITRKKKLMVIKNEMRKKEPNFRKN